MGEEELLVKTVNGGIIECVTEFPNLGSLIAGNGRIDVDIGKRIASTSKVLVHYLYLYSRILDCLVPPRAGFTKGVF